MINPPPSRRVLIAPKLKTLSIEARPSNQPLGRAVFTDLLVRLIRAGQAEREITPTPIDDALPRSVSSRNAPSTTRKVAS